MKTDPTKDLKSIFSAALDRVDPYKMITDHVKIRGGILEISFENEQKLFDLTNFDRIFVLGAGKASAKMAKAVEEIFGDRISGGILSLKKGHEENLHLMRTILSGHPLPDANSVVAAKMMVDTAKEFTEKTLVISLISGGGSALLEYPLSFEEENIYLTIDDIIKTTKHLLECGADINEFNCVRKHLSAVKGGKFAKIIYPATSINFILSDVVGDNLDVIASGLTVKDESTRMDALGIIKKYGMETALPENVVASLVYGNGLPKVVESKKYFSRVNNVLIGTNSLALKAASFKARELGYETMILTSRLTGEASEAAKFLAGVAKSIAANGEPLRSPACVISGGETTVTIRGNGKGGRNQELALSYLSELQKDSLFAEQIWLLSASTDGNDGPTDSAGAFAFRQLIDEAENKKLLMADYLTNNDSYHFFEKVGGLFKTGPTNTNVCDVQIQLVV